MGFKVFINVFDTDISVTITTAVIHNATNHSLIVYIPVIKYIKKHLNVEYLLATTLHFVIMSYKPFISSLYMPINAK